MRTHFSILLLIALLMFSCTRKSRDVQYEITYLPCENEATEEYGFIDVEGQFFPTLEFDDATPVINGYSVIDGTLYRVGKKISDTVPVLRNLMEYGIMSDGLIPVCRENSYISVVDKNGKEVFKLSAFEDIEVSYCYSYSDSKLRVALVDESFVYVDNAGRRLFDTRYSWATDFINGHGIVQTINQHENLFSLIDETGMPIFTFESSDEDYIVVSHELELLSAKENDKIIIYDFKGNRILTCPSKVYSIYAFCYDGFIYSNSSDEFGLMTYEGESLIRAKYEQLVPNGKYFLATTGDDNIRLIDKNDNLIKDYDGDEILSYQHEGCSFPNAMETSEINYLIVDANGRVIAEDLDFYYDPYDLEYVRYVENLYLPEDRIINTIMELCGEGKGMSDKYGAFFIRSNIHCKPQDITFLPKESCARFAEKTSILYRLDEGVNYELLYEVIFDDPVVNKGSDKLNPYAWLEQVALHVRTSTNASNKALFNKCIDALKKKGCQVFYSNRTDCILFSKDKNQLYVFINNWEKKTRDFTITMMPNNENNREYWKLCIDSNMK